MRRVGKRRGKGLTTERGVFHVPWYPFTIPRAEVVDKIVKRVKGNGKLIKNMVWGP